MADRVCKGFDCSIGLKQTYKRAAIRFLQTQKDLDMTKTNDLSRRKLLGRIGLLAAAGYSVPALTTLSMAQAGSGPSGGGNSGGNDDNGPSNSNDDNGPSSSNHDSGPSSSNDDNGTGGGTGGGTATDPAVVEATCGAENLNDPVYLQCLVDNGF